MANDEDLRRRHAAEAAALLPVMVARLEWPADRLAEFRLAQLRRTIRVAKGRPAVGETRVFARVPYPGEPVGLLVEGDTVWATVPTSST